MSEQTINKGLMIAGGLLGLGILGYLFFREKEEVVEDAEFTIVEDSKPTVQKPAKAEKTIVPVIKMKPVESTKEEEKVIPTTAEASIEPNDDFPLKLGSKGERVRQLQIYLLRNHGAQKIVNEEFDAVTETHVLKYLKEKEVSEELFLKLNMANLKTQKNNA
ncbi:MAG: hypothetical protein ABNH00_11740 [Dokdonia sp.]|jgi:hypothetical protein